MHLLSCKDHFRRDERWRVHLKGQLMRFEAIARVLPQPLHQFQGLAKRVFSLRQLLPKGVWILLLFLLLVLRGGRRPFDCR